VHTLGRELANRNRLGTVLSQTRRRLQRFLARTVRPSPDTGRDGGHSGVSVDAVIPDFLVPPNVVS